MNKEPMGAPTINAKRVITETTISTSAAMATLGTWYGWPDLRAELFPPVAFLLAGTAILLWPRLERYIQGLRETTQEGWDKRTALGMPFLVFSVFLLVMITNEADTSHIEKTGRNLTTASGLLGSFLLLFHMLHRPTNWLWRKLSLQSREQQQ